MTLMPAPTGPAGEKGAAAGALALLIVSVFALAVVHVSFAQADAPAPAAANTASIENAVSAEQPPEPEPPQSRIEVKAGLLSVELYDMEFGRAMEEVARQAGFKADVRPDVYSRKLSTSFEGVELEKGVLRMLNLVREKNYSMYYDDKGGISLIEVLGAQAGSAPSVQSPSRPGTFPARRAFPQTKSQRNKPQTQGVQPYTPAPEPARPAVRRTPARIAPLPPAPPAIEEEPRPSTEEEIREQEDLNGVEEAPESAAPLIPHKEPPQYIPKKTE